jgi:UDP-galactopyranose mutase
MSKSIAAGELSRHALATSSEATPIVCFSHLRWDFVYQRPQHLMSRFARQGRVFYVEEPLYGAEVARCDVSVRNDGVHVVVPWLPHGLTEESCNYLLRGLLAELIKHNAITSFVAWYYTPMALPWTRHLESVAVVYDCMDELSLFRGAPAEMVERERELIAHADVVFTGGTSLYEAKRVKSDNVHCFPSSVDATHFRKARVPGADPADQAGIPHVRLGFAGVIDERMNIDLLAAIASARPDWHLVMLGPIVKIDRAHLPQGANIHYLGPKPYAELPAYLARWDIALLPFALNESTRFISPTKTPEYLAAGLPVVSTPIRDVVAPYGIAELARIGTTAKDFVDAVESLLRQSNGDRAKWMKRVDGFLSTMSWDRTHDQMAELIAQATALKGEAEVDDLTFTRLRRLAAATARHDVAMEA